MLGGRNHKLIVTNIGEAVIGSTVLSIEFVQTSVLLGCRAGDVELATETFA